MYFDKSNFLESFALPGKVRDGLRDHEQTGGKALELRKGGEGRVNPIGS